MMALADDESLPYGPISRIFSARGLSWTTAYTPCFIGTVLPARRAATSSPWRDRRGRPVPPALQPRHLSALRLRHLSAPHRSDAGRQRPERDPAAGTSWTGAITPRRASRSTVGNADPEQVGQLSPRQELAGGDAG
jgi:hypothetical protein